jgi:hypothetical protein
LQPIQPSSRPAFRPRADHSRLNLVVRNQVRTLLEVRLARSRCLRTKPRVRGCQP